MKISKLTLAATLGLSLTTGALMAQNPPANRPAPSHNATESVIPHLNGRPVMDTQGNELGKIDRVINKDDQSGPRFVVINNKGKETVVPYEKLGMKEPTRITLDTTAEKMASAPQWVSEKSASAIENFWGSNSASAAANPSTGTNASGNRPSSTMDVNPADNSGLDLGADANATTPTNAAGNRPTAKPGTTEKQE